MIAIQHDSNYTATKRKVCLGPGTKIQASGNLFCRKISPLNVLLNCWDFFAKIGGGGAAFYPSDGTNVGEQAKKFTFIFIRPLTSHRSRDDGFALQC